VADHHPVNQQGVRCPRCNKQYDFWTNNGRLIGPFHPMGDCKSPALRLANTNACVICDEDVPEGRPGGAKTCSPRCSKALDAREKEINRKLAIARAEARTLAKQAQIAESKQWFADYKANKAQKRAAS
jgi:predicted nucleic acid-binding Zn ribbon protein